MSLSLCLTFLPSSSSSSPQSQPTIPLLKQRNPTIFPSRKLLIKPHPIRSVQEQFDHQQPLSPTTPKWENILSDAASLYPLYVTAGGVVACVKPSVFGWFVERGPASYSLSLGLIMLSMGITLKLRDFFNLFLERPFSILFGCIAQYTIMPTFGLIISKALRLSPSLSVGLILLACCPSGTASNVVTLIARGDVPLSIVVTICTTFGAVILTPLLTKILAGAHVPVNAAGLSISTFQVVVGPILLGSYMQTMFPQVVKAITPFSPLFAVLTSSLLACSVFSENVVRLKSSMVSASLASDASPFLCVQSLLSGELGRVMLSVLLLHFAGFFVGYIAASIAGFGERQRRAISVEVGMQNSSLGVILATSHFPSPMVALPAAMSAVIMNIMGSSLGFFWRNINPEADGIRLNGNGKPRFMIDQRDSIQPLPDLFSLFSKILDLQYTDEHD